MLLLLTVFTLLAANSFFVAAADCVSLPAAHSLFSLVSADCVSLPAAGSAVVLVCLLLTVCFLL